KRYIKYFTSPDPLMAAMTDIEIMPDTKCDEPEYLKMLEENYRLSLSHRYRFISDYLKHLDFYQMGTNINRAITDDDMCGVNTALYYLPRTFGLPYLKVRDSKGLNALQNAILKGNENVTETILEKIPLDKISECLKPKESFKLAIRGDSPKLIRSVLSLMKKEDKLSQMKEGLKIALEGKLSEATLIELLNEIETYTPDEKKLCFDQTTFVLAAPLYSDKMVKKLLNNCDDYLIADFLQYQPAHINVLEAILLQKDINENIPLIFFDRIKNLPTAMKILLLPSNVMFLATGTNNIKIVRKVLEIIPECVKATQLQFKNSIHLNCFEQSLMDRPFKPLIALEILKEIESLEKADIVKSINKQSLYLAVCTNNTPSVKKLLETAPRSLKEEMLAFEEVKKGVLEAAFDNKPCNFEIIEEILTALEALDKKDSEILMGENSLYLAARSNSLQIFRRVKNLLPEDKMPFLFNKRGKGNCLHVAARKAKNLEMIKEILLSCEEEKRVEFVKDTTNHGATAIYAAISSLTYAHIENIKTILEMIPAKDRVSCLKITGGIKGFTPLHLLMKKLSSPANAAVELVLSSIDTIEEIHELLSIKDFDGNSPLDYAFSSVKEIVNNIIGKKRLAEKDDSSSRPHKRLRPISAFEFNE
ncbi:MAG: hypothetical protein K940chlam1_00754, partial [Candidatus Anoxychlamydiales bacterium]|nr:hypothetical protein [Candidatus Anoxychlamydiales bacterium]